MFCVLVFQSYVVIAVSHHSRFLFVVIVSHYRHFECLCGYCFSLPLFLSHRGRFVSMLFWVSSCCLFRHSSLGQFVVVLSPLGSLAIWIPLFSLFYLRTCPHSDNLWKSDREINKFISSRQLAGPCISTIFFTKVREKKKNFQSSGVMSVSSIISCPTLG